jgi:hypothetical protein
MTDAPEGVGREIACPSTHCNRSLECRSRHECSSPEKTWGDVFWQWIAAGHDRSSAAYQADKWEKRARATIRALPLTTETG